jgi:conjugal transfer pilus assembly protein TraE
VIPQKFVTTSSNKAREITFLRVLVFGLLVIIALVGALLYRTLWMEKTIIVPPSIQKSFWVNGDSVSKSYLEQMAYWYAGLALTVSPATGNYQKDLFLRYATPAGSGQLAAEMTARLEYMAKNNTATMFTAQTLTTDEKLMKVAITGDLETFVGDKRISSKHTIYVVGFKYINEKLFVNELKETNEKDIFGVSTPGQ